MNILRHIKPLAQAIEALGEARGEAQAQARAQARARAKLTKAFQDDPVTLAAINRALDDQDDQPQDEAGPNHGPGATMA